MPMVSLITRLRSVRWLPSRRLKAQAISISRTAKSLRLRSVSVTSAFEPSPPRRHDCEEIFRPSSGDLPGAVVSGAAISGAVATAAAAVPSAGGEACADSTQVAFCTAPVVSTDGTCADRSWASLNSGTVIQAVSPAAATTGKITSFALWRQNEQPLILIAAPSINGERAGLPPRKAIRHYAVRLL